MLRYKTIILWDIPLVLELYVGALGLNDEKMIPYHFIRSSEDICNIFFPLNLSEFCLLKSYWMTASLIITSPRKTPSALLDYRRCLVSVQHLRICQQSKRFGSRYS